MNFAVFKSRSNPDFALKFSEWGGNRAAHFVFCEQRSEDGARDCTFTHSGRPGVRRIGEIAGHVREVALSPQDDPSRVSEFIVKTRDGDRLLPSKQVYAVLGATVRASTNSGEWPPLVSSEGMLLLERDLLDQQIIDVSGRKVVRVNDVDLQPEPVNGSIKLRIGRVDVGLRGAVRRLLKGLAPAAAIEALASRM